MVFSSIGSGAHEATVQCVMQHGFWQTDVQRAVEGPIFLSPDFTAAGKWAHTMVERSQFSPAVLAQIEALGQPLSVMDYDTARPWFAFPVAIAVDAATDARAGAATQWENGWASAT